jgi:nitroreductase
MNTAWETLITAAIRAPSGDNRQPWRFEIDPAAGKLSILLDPDRDPSLINAGQRFARIALGAAWENVERTARHQRWDLTETAISGASIDLECRWGAVPTAPLDPLIIRRASNRRVYDARALDSSLQHLLAKQTPERHGVTTHWVFDRQRIQSLAELIAAADGVMFGHPSLRQAILANIRFDAPRAAEVDEGLSLASLEASAAQRWALRYLCQLPQSFLKLTGALQIFAYHAQKLVASASGLCLAVASDTRATTDVYVGKAMQQAWLALTAAGLAAQPMMSLLVLENLHDHPDTQLVPALGKCRLAELREALRRLVPEIGAGRPAFLLRFGYAPPPSGRTGRLDWQMVTAQVPAAALPVSHSS